MASIPEDKAREQLGKLTPLNLLPEQVLSQLLQEVSVEYLNRGEYLFHEGDTEPENVYLLSGKVALLKGETEVETLTGNTEAARFALAHQFPRQHAARARSRVECVRIDSHRLSELIENARADAYKAEQQSAEKQDWKSLLLQSRIFQHIPRANIRHVISRMERIDVRRDEEIILQGEEGDYFYFISEGRCAVSRKPADSRQSIEVARLGPGDCFGEDALLSDNLRSSTVSMLSDGVLMRLRKDDFISLIKHPLATTVNFADACRITAANGVWLDIRAPAEYRQGHMDGSINLPLNSLRFQVSSLASGRQYVIYCRDGRYSAVAAFLLLERGFDAVILEGGVQSIPAQRLVRQQKPSQKPGAKIINLRPSDVVDAAPQGPVAQTLAQKLQALEQKTRQTEASNAALRRQIERLKSGKKEREVELEVLLTTAQEQEQAETAQLQTLRDRIERLQQQLATAESARDEALRQLQQRKVADASSLLCTPDLAEIEQVAQRRQTDPVREGVRSEAPPREERIQSVLDRLGQRATMDAVDQEAIRQELEQLHNAIRERNSDMERAIQEQRSLEDALEDRDAHLEQIKQEMEQLRVKLESAILRYEQADEAHRQAEGMVERLKEQIKNHKTRGIVPTVMENDAGGGGQWIRGGLLGALAGGLLCFAVLDALLVFNGKEEIISSLSGERFVQETLSRWLAPEEPAVATPVTQPVRPEHAPKAQAVPEVSPVAVRPGRPEAPKVLRDRLRDGSAGPVMVAVPAGEFMMGSDRSTLVQDERPLHRVVLKRFYAGRYEVTFEEYDRFARATGRSLPDDQGWGRGRRPVINVSWDDAIAYTVWLSEQTGARYRLPSEAEWEYAAGAGRRSLYWWGYRLEEGRANCYDCGVQWAGGRTAPVGAFKANPFGLHNTAGNVMEWVQDCYRPNYIGAPADGRAWDAPLCKQRVVRGGAYSKAGVSMRTTERGKQIPSSRLSVLGFRVVRE